MTGTPCRQTSPNSVGWLASEVDDWIKARVAERDAKLQKQAALPHAQQPGESDGS